jgi:hypothetical protein|tara:strand:+ start:78 stop:578 length:501 start_codon:yes stop_codon:yes gene_type:complete
MLRIIFISLLFISSLSHAEETRQADAHVHGLNNLTMVLSQNQIAMTYEMPIIQLYDEHDEHDESAINNEALKVFQNHLQLFEFPIEAECEISSFKSGLHSVSTEEGDHQDVELAYEFYCNKPSLLKNLTITAFDRFSELETLNFDAVINNKGFTKRFKSEDNKIIF